MGDYGGGRGRKWGAVGIYGGKWGQKWGSVGVYRGKWKFMGEGMGDYVGRMGEEMGEESEEGGFTRGGGGNNKLMEALPPNSYGVEDPKVRGGLYHREGGGGIIIN